jgi:CRP/FNR family cyclic AMP-dependent transcriptional regulator
MPRHATIADAAQAIAESSFYGRLTEADRAQLRGCCIKQTYAPGSELMLEGTPAYSAAILVRGWAISVFTTEIATEMALRIYGPGDLFGSEAMFQDQRCPETVTALVPCVALMIPGPRFAELLSRSRNLASAFRHIMGWRALAADEQAKSRYYSPANRLAGVLVNLADRHGVQAPDGITIPVELSQEQLGGLIGASRSTVARVLRHLRRQGIVHTGYRRITVTALQPLQTIAKDPW